MAMLDIWSLFFWNYCGCEIRTRKVCIRGLLLFFCTESVVTVTYGYLIYLALVVRANLLELRLLTVFIQIQEKAEFMTKDTVSKSVMTPK